MEHNVQDRFDASSAYHYSDFEILMKIASEDPSMQVQCECHHINTLLEPQLVTPIAGVSQGHH